MKYFRITLQYDGSRYVGWQKQGNTENTVQGKIEAMLTKLFEQQVEIQGSGRTDAGVHALGQVASFSVKTDLGPAKVMERMNTFLPKDIIVTDCQLTDARFHARLNAKNKTYIYRIVTGCIRPVFGRQYVLWHQESLDTDSMRKASECLVGEHDFKSFLGNRHYKKSTIRTIESITITEDIIKSGDAIFPEITMAFSGNGFLPNMVRILAGTLLEIGEGQRNPLDMEYILKGCDRALAGPTARGIATTSISISTRLITLFLVVIFNSFLHISPKNI